MLFTDKMIASTSRRPSTKSERVSELRIPERFCGRPTFESGASEKDEMGGGFSRRGEEKESRNNFLLFPPP